MNVTWRDDRFHDECGLFGIWNHPEAGILVTPEFVAAGSVYARDVFCKMR